MKMRTCILFVCLLVAACGETPGDPETDLREWVANAEAAAEEKNRGDLLALISENYADARGNDYQSVGDKLRVYFFRQDKIGLISTIDEISLMGATAAMVNLTVAMAGTYNSRIGFNADAYQFELELEKADDEWQLIGARWGSFGNSMR